MKEIIFDTNKLNEVFSNESLACFEIMKSICEDFKGVQYSFMPPEEFKKLEKLEEINYIYWNEIIQRSHIVSMTNLFRNKKWFDGIAFSYYNNNHYSFCANLRGLIESCADSFHSLRLVPLNVAAHFDSIRLALNGELKNTFIDFQEVEDLLIHHTYGRKLTKSEKEDFPKEHDALTIRKYLESIKNENEKVFDLYAELCQITHPASNSILPYIISNQNDLYFLMDFNSDEALMKNVLKEYQETIDKTIRYSTALSLLTLKLINLLDSMSALHTNEQYLVSIYSSELWLEIEREIANSKIKE